MTSLSDEEFAENRRWDECRTRRNRLIEFPDETQLYDGIPIKNWNLYYQWFHQLNRTPGSEFLNVYYQCEHDAIRILKERYLKEEARKLADQKACEQEELEFKEFLEIHPEYNELSSDELLHLRLDIRLAKLENRTMSNTKSSKNMQIEDASHYECTDSPRVARIEKGVLSDFILRQGEMGRCFCMEDCVPGFCDVRKYGRPSAYVIGVTHGTTLEGGRHLKPGHYLEYLCSHHGLSLTYYLDMIYEKYKSSFESPRAFGGPPFVVYVFDEEAAKNTKKIFQHRATTQCVERFFRERRERAQKKALDEIQEREKKENERLEKEQVEHEKEVVDAKATLLKESSQRVLKVLDSYRPLYPSQFNEAKLTFYNDELKGVEYDHRCIYDTLNAHSPKDYAERKYCQGNLTLQGREMGPASTMAYVLIDRRIPFSSQKTHGGNDNNGPKILSCICHTHAKYLLQAFKMTSDHHEMSINDIHGFLLWDSRGEMPNVPSEKRHYDTFELVEGEINPRDRYVMRTGNVGNCKECQGHFLFSGVNLCDACDEKLKSRGCQKCKVPITKETIVYGFPIGIEKEYLCRSCYCCLDCGKTLQSSIECKARGLKYDEYGGNTRATRYKNERICYACSDKRKDHGGHDQDPEWISHHKFLRGLGMRW